MMKKILIVILSMLFCSNVLAAKYGNGSSRPTPVRSVPSRSSPSPSVKPSPPPSYKPSNSSNSNIGSKPKPSVNSYDSVAAVDKRKEDSQRAWEAGQRAKAEQAAKAKADAQKTTYGSNYIPPKTNIPPPVYRTPNGTSHVVNDNQTAYLKGRLDESRFQHREDRYRSFYGSRYSYYYSRPVVYYDDHYSSSYWWYLRDQNYHTQALFAYNHRYEMDERRYLDLLAIAGVASEVAYLESLHTTRNPFWTPSGMDYDLMCNDTYVQSVYHYNPSPAPVVVVSSGHGFWHFCVWVFWIGLIVVIIIGTLIIIGVVG